jgi:ketosteroid isomerase-like protein
MPRGGSLAVVRRAFEAYASHDVEALLEVVEPDVEIRSLMTEAERSSYTGSNSVREWFAAVLDVFPDWRPRLLELRDHGPDAVIAFFDVTATATESGVPIHQTYWYAARLRDGRIAWWGFFRSEADAVAAL